MRVAALYDIHGNLPALEAVLAEVERSGVDAIVAGGDIASGPMPVQTLDLLRGLGERVRFVRGNADRELIAAYERWAAGAMHAEQSGPALEPTAAWAAQRLTSAHRELLATLAPSVRLSVAGLGEVLFCHASPRSDEEILTANSPEQRIADALAAEPAAVAVAGHTHVRFERALGGRRFVNAGSVGMPYEDAPGAYWALLGPAVSLRRTAYDYRAAGEAIEATGFPQAQEMVRECLLEPIGAARATAFFEQLARKREAPFTRG